MRRYTSDLIAVILTALFAPACSLFAQDFSTSLPQQINEYNGQYGTNGRYGTNGQLPNQLLADTASLYAPAPSGPDQPNIDRVRQRRIQLWQAIIPRQYIVQYAGNIGLMSVGLGWDYGRRRQWETHLLFGFVPRYNSDCAKATMTLRELYRPWDIPIRGHVLLRHPRTRLTYSPLTVSYAMNTVFHHEFWNRQPDRYPKGYYWFSLRMRHHLALGQRFSHTFVTDNRIGIHGYSFYWDVSTTELDIIYKIQNHAVPLRDILHLGVGVKLQMM